LLRGELRAIQIGEAAVVEAVIARDKREAFAQGSEATKQSMSPDSERWIASLRSQ
jgi:hypothetical protein